MSRTITVLHPGEMGSAMAGILAAAGHRVLWVSAGRSQATRERAKAAGLVESPSLEQALREAEIVFSICPPHAALDVAREVAALRFKGIYVDANAVAPDTVRTVGGIVSAGGARWVDGGILGSPPGPGIKTRIFLCGAEAPQIAALFAGSVVGASMLEGEAGAASALKMCYAAWTKGSTALLANIRSLARAHAVEDVLLAEWEISRAAPVGDSGRVTGSARKAWRWAPEMEEIAASFESMGLPGGFHHGAAEVYRRLEQFKDTPQQPSFGTVSDALLSQKK